MAQNADSKPDKATEPTQLADLDKIAKALAEAPYIVATAVEQEQATLKEYSQYVATEQIYIGSALAFDAGHPVPATHVRLGVVRADQVKPA